MCLLSYIFIFKCKLPGSKTGLRLDRGYFLSVEPEIRSGFKSGGCFRRAFYGFIASISSLLLIFFFFNFLLVCYQGRWVGMAGVEALYLVFSTCSP